MKPKLLLCLALVLSCGLFGCSTAHRSATVGQTKLIGRWTVEGTDDVVTLAEGNSASLKSGGKDSAGSYFIQTNLLLLTLTLHDKASPSERRFVQYLISPGTWSSRILQRVYIDPDTSRMFIPMETLTARQLAEVIKNFHLMRPGMTEDEVFSMLGLAGYQHRLYPANFSRSNDWGMSDYQLAENEVLQLFLDNTGMKTTKVQLPDGDKLEVWDYENSHVTNRLVIKAELDRVASFSNSPSIWRPILKWP